ncbi:23S rRNA (guanosine(2251)-2'-O)-methyltransferase RlmB [Synechococcus sp. A15-28]|jgi:23S rRNA (guanosine2251-2'-O)-methyltransferase|uniref:23S rRNA (guanosine(2251)-2'-O)-methyltransferase RlmB n=1 Tax=Synechococcus sp. A15-28 TaxID=1050638 RepID=UPI001647607D|nr:23S rRNA (guanosine(2251)-2'-O)-methyltransferase RlmB [Synechococcus sp. A15-28]QNI42097.1 23S rRNA (guanosine2251-2'-O)-methyltransferase [Synechococcus sp. A15-28]
MSPRFERRPGGSSRTGRPGRSDRRRPDDDRREWNQEEPVRRRRIEDRPRGRSDDERRARPDRGDRGGRSRFMADRRPERPERREGRRDDQRRDERSYGRRDDAQGDRRGDRRPSFQRERSRLPFRDRPQRRPEGEAAAATPPADDLVWGRHAALAALEAGRPIHRIWCTPEMRSAAKFLQLLRDAKASGVLVEEVTWARLGQITGGSVHQGIALQTAAADTIDLESLIDGCSDLGEPPLLLALDGVTDPHNLGAVVRSAEAMGAHGVVLPQRRSAGLTGSAAKVAAGALEHLPVARVVNLNRSLEKLKDAGYRVIGLAGEGDVTLPDVDLSGPLVLVTGSEDQGLSLLTRRHCDQLVRIPLRGVTPSLNASVATALCVYEVARRNWMKDIHGQAPSPPIQRARMAGQRDDDMPEQPVETAPPEERIELELERRDRDAGLEFDQSIQLSP